MAHGLFLNDFPVIPAVEGAVSFGIAGSAAVELVTGVSLGIRAGIIKNRARLRKVVEASGEGWGRIRGNYGRFGTFFESRESF